MTPTPTPQRELARPMTQAQRRFLHAKRVGPTLVPDRSRVLLRPFRPISPEIAGRIVARVLALSEQEVVRLHREVLDEFEDRHVAIREYLQTRFAQVQHHIGADVRPSLERRALIGSYFTHEYSPESAALFNPSIVPHPDQSGLPEGALRFILSLRATGEGHISSIMFRTGAISAQHRITLTPPVSLVSEPARVPDPIYEKPIFARKLEEAGALTEGCRRVLDRLPDIFTIDQLRELLLPIQTHGDPADGIMAHDVRAILLLAESNYEVHFSPQSHTSQRVLFPSAPSQSNGIEDARFVRFHDDDGRATYFATYTAYDGKIILPQLIETADFVHFKFSTLNGPAVQNKGMALFPRRIDGRYVMLSRQDDETLMVMFSDNVRFWQNPEPLIGPASPWEFFKIGNCGSPMETSHGWLVLSHGVGPMRKYCLGAFLLDLDNPRKVLGRLREPLLEPNESEREGYVPNVVYTCGALLHDGELIVPYAMSDYATSFATVTLDDLLAAME